MSIQNANVEETMLVEYLQTAIKNANKNTAIKDVQIDGMTSDLVRGLLNNLVGGNLFPVSYLEIGVFKGATFVSALYKNKPNYAVAVDNWSEFDRPKQAFFDNCQKYLNNEDFVLFEQDCFTIDKLAFAKPINIFFYDGDHFDPATYKAVTHFYDMLADTFILLIDDWNFEGTPFEVRVGARKAMKELNLKVDYEVDLPAAFNGDIEQWWNGLYAAVLRK